MFTQREEIAMDRVFVLVLLCVFCLNLGFSASESDIPKGAASLVFVFDTTGSMYDDLVQVRAGASRILSTTLERKVKPLYNYVLIPFHDPDVGPASVTTSPEKFQQQLDDLFVQGGGDCPEMTLSAITLALEISLPGSFIYIFTDSHAKDYDLTQKVMRLIQEKKSQVIFVITGDCGNSTLSPGFTAFKVISATSSGQVFRLKKRDVNQVLKFVEETVQANRVNILSTDIAAATERTYIVPVDNTLEELTISLSGPDATLMLYDPEGHLFTKEKGLQRLLNLKGVKIIAVEKPKPGLWSLKTSSSGSHTLRITGYSSLNFVSGFELRPIRSLEEAVQRPVAGFRNFALIKVNGLQPPGAAEKAQVLNLQGQVVKEVLFKPRKTDKFTFDWLDFEPPRELFYVRVLGVDDKGNVFHRASPTALSAVLPEPPKVTVPPIREVLLGSRVTLWCTVNTNAPTKIQWTMGRRTLGPVLTRIGLVNVTHSIPLVSHKDRGPYSCFASNVGGTDTVTTALIIKVPRPVVLHRPHSNLTVVTGDALLLTCAPFSATPSVSRWRKDGKGLESSSSTFPQQNGSLLLHIHGRKDAGRYECVAVNQGREIVRAVDIVVYERPFAYVDSPSQSFQRGNNVSIHCRVSGYPVPSLMWYKDGQHLETGGKLTVTRDNALHIRDAQVSDAGLYECVVWNIAGQNQATVKLEYTISPSVIVDRASIVTKAGDTVTILCKANAKPEARILWFKGQDKVVPDRRIAVSSRGHLVINAVKLSDGGFYTCLADNVAGQDSRSVPVRVQVPPRVTVESEDVPLVLGKTLVMQCAAVGVPTPNITWQKNEADVESSDRVSIDDQGLLIIREARPEDAGTYHCVGRSPAGTSAAVVTVRGEETRVSPKISTPPSDKTVTIGDNVTFICRATGIPKPYIMWYSNLEIAADTDPRATVLPSGDLVIRDIELKDAGRYVCLAENSLGRDMAQVTLTLTDLTPPIILKPPKTTMIAERGGTVELPCPTLGTPRPTISWRKNGQRVFIDGEKFNQTNAGTLIIRSLLPLDSGSYLCTAKNRAGLDLLSLALYVYISPEIVRSPPNMIVDEGDTILMECVARGFPIPHIRWFRDNQTLPHNVSSIELSQLKIQDAGVYRCVAENVAGKASATTVLNVRSPPKVFETRTPVVVLSGRLAELNCNVTGYPKPTVTWLRQGVPVPRGDPKYLVLPSGNLRIFGVLPSDSGTYVCVARNPLGNARQPSELFVLVPPKIVEHPRNITIDEGDTVILKCVASGFPAPYMTWYMNGSTLITNSFTVEITEAKKAEHEGIYRCEAQNQAGKVSASAVVIVKEQDSNGAQSGRPEFIHKPQDTNVDAGEDVRWDCTAKGEPKPKMMWKKDDNQAFSSSLPKHIQILANNSLVIQAVKPGDEGQYQCHASNGFGAHVVQAKLVVRVNGGWSDWQEWRACSQSCGNGSQYRYRTCDNPTPGQNGRPCTGTSVESRFCNTRPCPVDGQWSLWTEWTPCSKVCDGGEQTRYRECNNPAAMFGGEECEGSKREGRPCNLFECPDSVAVAIGQVHGAINKVMLPNLFLLANITKTPTNDSRVSCTVSGMPGPIRHWLKSSLIPLTAPVYWATAGEKPGSQNGLAITKGRFVYTTQMDFETGESLLVEQRGEGVNEKGVFVIDVDIRGGTPKFPMGATFAFPDFNETFVQTGDGQISSTTERVISVDGKSIPYKCNTTIAYSPESDEPKSVAQTVQVTAVDISYPDQIDTLNIDMTTSIQRATVSNQCPSGLTKDPSSRFCQDIDECIAVPRVCSQYCQNLFGSYSCSCAVGHVLAADSKTCEDIDECGLGTVSCPLGQECVNTPGGYRCRVKCSDGFVMSDNETCVDLNECEFARTTDSLDPNDPCLHDCVNLQGSYRCSCKRGYELIGDLCEDIDECSSKVCKHGCQNLEGSYSCYCYQGYRLISDSQCVDIDECAENGTICADLQCVNIPGSFQCLRRCEVGFKRTTDDEECVDVNECNEGQHNCKLNQMCMNTVGSFYCVCPRGYSAKTPQSACEDVDECKQFPGICEFHCVNSVGSFECLCPAGGILNADQRTCAGVDGCLLNNLRCEQRCSFSAQGYYCSCPRGYRLAENRQDCVDVDECASNSTNSCQFACTNTMGSFKCRCPVGYYLSPDGTKCLDVDECSLTQGPCNHQQCFNTRGGYRCLPSSCPQKYHQVGGGFCVNQCSNSGYCTWQALHQNVITLPQGVPANTVVGRLVPFFPPYMASMRYYYDFHYSFSTNPSPFGAKMVSNEVVIYTTENLSTSGIHQLQLIANLYYVGGTLACRTAFTVYIDVAKFSF